MSEPAAVSDADEGGLDDDEEIPAHDLVTSDAALSLEEAGALAGRRGVTLALLLGEVGTGKSTLLAELWTEFMVHGEIGQTGFAGSTTALAFEERAYHSRLKSGRAASAQRRTTENDDGFLHLRAARDGGALVELLAADITGEHFTRIREGTPLLEELAFAGRADRFAFLVDGAAIADRAQRENAFNRTRRLIRQLTTSRCVVATARAALVLTKQDELQRDDIGVYAKFETKLLGLLQKLDDEAEAFQVAARPRDGSDPSGLEPLMAWLTCPDRSVAAARTLESGSRRAFARFTA